MFSFFRRSAPDDHDEDEDYYSSQYSSSEESECSSESYETDDSECGVAEKDELGKGHQDWRGKQAENGPSAEAYEVAEAGEPNVKPTAKDKVNAGGDTNPPLVVCGPSGVGKGTIIDMVMKKYAPSFGFCVSHTTRLPREGEVDGEHYHFITVAEMHRRIEEASFFLEHAEVHGRYYGTSVSAVEAVRRNGRICVLDIDTEGVRSVKRSTLEARYVFIAPPSMEVLEARLGGRGTESEEDIQRRLKNASRELEYGKEEGNFHLVLVNDDLNKAFDELESNLVVWYPHLKRDSWRIDTTLGSKDDHLGENSAGCPKEAVPEAFVSTVEEGTSLRETESNLQAQASDDQPREAAVVVAESSLEKSGFRHMNRLSKPTAVVGNEDDVKGLHDDDVDDDDSSKDDEYDSDNVSDTSGGESEGSDDGLRTLFERRQLLLLATEHDRVDILKALLSTQVDGNLGDEVVKCPDSREADAATVSLLINGVGFESSSDDMDVFVPPLHASILHGSVQTATCLLRTGADPSIIPDIPAGFVPCDGDDAQELRQGALRGSKYNPSRSEVNKWAKLDGASAWELAFGRIHLSTNGECPLADFVETNRLNATTPQHQNKSWFSWGLSKQAVHSKNAANGAPAPEELVAVEADKTYSGSPSKDSRGRLLCAIPPLDLPASKLEALSHAFSAEALRAIGSDESNRLRQLLDSGMPEDTEMGGRTLLRWCEEMAAKSCEKMLHSRASISIATAEPAEGGEKKNDDDEEEEDEEKWEASEVDSVAAAGTPAINFGGDSEAREDKQESDLIHILSSLANEEQLAEALSSTLDSLAEEVSVCHGLLTAGGSSAALARHARSLKEQRRQREEDLEDAQCEWRMMEEEVVLLTEQLGEGGRFDIDLIPNEMETGAIADKALVPSDLEGVTTEEKNCSAKTRLSVAERRVRKLRTSIADLSQEHGKNLDEVEKRGLSAGLQYARTLREDLQEIEFALSEARIGAASCRAQATFLRTKIEQGLNPAVRASSTREATHKAGRDIKVSAQMEPLRVAVAVPVSSSDSIETHTEHIPPLLETTTNTPSSSPGSHTRVHQEPLRFTASNSSGKAVAVAGRCLDDSMIETASPSDVSTVALDDDDGLGAETADPNTDLSAEGHEEIAEEDVPPDQISAEEEGTVAVSEEGSSQKSNAASYETDSHASSEYETESDGDTDYEMDYDEAAVMSGRSLSLPSESIAGGQSTSIAIRDPNTPGYLPAHLWDLLRRIVEYGRDAVTRTARGFRRGESGGVPIMIV